MVTDIIRDTVSVLDATRVAEFYADMLEKQQGQFNILLVALGLIVASVIGATWWWNYKGSKAQITEEIQTGLKKFQRMFTTYNASMEKLVEEKVKLKMDSFMESVNTDLDNYKLEVLKESKMQNADLSRVFALHCSTEKSFFYGARWWMSAFEGYVVLDNGKFEQISIDALVRSLEDCLGGEILSEQQVDLIPNLEARIKDIPDIYTEQRNKAKKLLKQIEVKAKKDK